MNSLDPRAEPFALSGGRVNCLLLHGFTASPSEMRFVGEFLNQRGYSVYAPLLPGHGTTPEHLSATGWTDWYLAVGEIAERLVEKGDPVVVIGLSMGALLALEVGARIRGISGIVTINPPLILRDWKTYWSRVFKVFRHYVPKNIDMSYRKMEEQGRFAYDKIPLRALISMQSMGKDVMRRLEYISVPVLIVQSGRDETVDPRSCKILQRSLPAGKNELLQLPEAGHVATMGKDRVWLATEVANFIERILVVGSDKIEDADNWPGPGLA
ncbi:MAG: alpha/beta fold hydrolase [Syntrophomonadaceae bacterium]|nr:alpha/beta fold hydrolase [Syntrophomonadaceae bacterium]